MSSVLPGWPEDLAVRMARHLGMPPGSDWTIILPFEAPRRDAATPFLMKHASDPPGQAHRFTLAFDEVEAAEGLMFQVFGRVAATPSTPFFWQLAPTPGLEHGLLIEVWAVAVAIGTTMRAELRYDPATGRMLRTIELEDEGDDWEQDVPLIKRAVRALQMRVLKRGPKKGTGAKYPTVEEWHRAIREKVLTKQTRAAADDQRLAAWLDISESLLYQLMRKWGPKTIADIQAGNFGDCNCRGCRAN
jgi:hypothetical protein